MSLDLKYGKVAGKNSDQTDGSEKKSDDIILHETESNVRNLCLVLAEGRQIFLNYSYLVSAELSDGNNFIQLLFTSHVVKIKGLRLEKLFEKLSSHMPAKIKCQEERYKYLKDEEVSLINE